MIWKPKQGHVDFLLCFSIILVVLHFKCLWINLSEFGAKSKVYVYSHFISFHFIWFPSTDVFRICFGEVLGYLALFKLEFAQFNGCRRTALTRQGLHWTVRATRPALSYWLTGNAEPASLSWQSTCSAHRPCAGTADWNPVSSGLAGALACGTLGAESLLPARLQENPGAGGESTVMEAQSPQDPLGLQLWGFVASSSHWQELISSGTLGSWSCWRRWGKVEGKVEKGEGSFAWLTAEGVCFQRTQERKGLMWKAGFLCLV